MQSVPAIARDLGVTYSSAQLTVSLYLLTFASAQLFIGPLSDKIGRRPVIFGGLILLGVASIGATFAPSIELLIVARILLWGATIGIASVVVLLLLSPVLSLWAILLPMVVYVFSNGILFPNAMAGAASVDRRIAGTAASFAGFCQLGTGAVVAFTISALPTETVAPYAIALVILSLAALAGVGLVYSGRRAR